jgi:hypothetical protein
MEKTEAEGPVFRVKDERELRPWKLGQWGFDAGAMRAFYRPSRSPVRLTFAIECDREKFDNGTLTGPEVAAHLMQVRCGGNIPTPGRLRALACQAINVAMTFKGSTTPSMMRVASLDPDDEIPF